MVFLGCSLFFHGQLWFLIFTARVVLDFFVWLFWVVFFYCGYFGLFFFSFFSRTIMVFGVTLIFIFFWCDANLHIFYVVTTIFIFYDLYYGFVVSAGVRGLVLVAGGSWPTVRSLRFVAGCS